MIVTLAITIASESSVAVGYALWHKKPLIQLLLTSLCVNLFTQSILWVVLNIFPYYYLTALFTAEICIVGIEGLILYLYRPNQLKPGEAMILSLTMNLASFAVGWFLPI